MTPKKLHVIFGLILLIVGITFDAIFVQTKISNAFKSDPITYLNSFPKQLYDLTKFYMIILGLTNIVLALLPSNSKNLPRTDWTICGLMVIGSILLIATGFWYASAGPSFKWELRCTTFTIALLSIIISLALKIYAVLSDKIF